MKIEVAMHDSIYMSQIFHPQQNLKQVNSPESDFCVSFAQYYKEHFSRIHSNTFKKDTLFLREMPVSESGIADLVVLSWNSQVVKDDPFQIRAFELKINDWQSGLIQAYRYKTYSNAAILVMPVKKTVPALKEESFFRSLGVGLWGFDEVNMVLHKYYTPRPKNPIIKKKRDNVIKSIPKYYAFTKDSYFLMESEKISK